MRLGLIGDVHAEDELLQITIDALTREHAVDRILCTGDLVDGLGDVDRAVALLVAANALIVRGNHDRWIRSDDMRSLPNAHRMTELQTETIALLKTLPATLTLDVPHPVHKDKPGKLLLCHGVHANDMCRLNPDDFGYAISSNDDLLKVLFDPTITFMVGGHTHKPMVRRFERGSGKPPLIVVNAGTLAREDAPGFVVLDLGAASGAGRVDFYRVVAESAPTSGRVVRESSITLA